jgi:hypothetical protein
MTTFRMPDDLLHASVPNALDQREEYAGPGVCERHDAFLDIVPWVKLPSLLNVGSAPLRRETDAQQKESFPPPNGVNPPRQSPRNRSGYIHGVTSNVIVGGRSFVHQSPRQIPWFFGADVRRGPRPCRGRCIIKHGQIEAATPAGVAEVLRDRAANEEAGRCLHQNDRAMFCWNGAIRPGGVLSLASQP